MPQMDAVFAVETFQVETRPLALGLRAPPNLTKARLWDYLHLACIASPCILPQVLQGHNPKFLVVSLSFHVMLVWFGVKIHLRPAQFSGFPRKKSVWDPQPFKVQPGTLPVNKLKTWKRVNGFDCCCEPFLTQPRFYVDYAVPKDKESLGLSCMMKSKRVHLTFMFQEKAAKRHFMNHEAMEFFAIHGLIMRVEDQRGTSLGRPVRVLPVAQGAWAAHTTDFLMFICCCRCCCCRPFFKRQTDKRVGSVSPGLWSLFLTSDTSWEDPSRVAGNQEWEMWEAKITALNKIVTIWSNANLQTDSTGPWVVSFVLLRVTSEDVLRTQFMIARSDMIDLMTKSWCDSLASSDVPKTSQLSFENFDEELEELFYHVLPVFIGCCCIWCWDGCPPVKQLLPQAQLETHKECEWWDRTHRPTTKSRCRFGEERRGRPKKSKNYCTKKLGSYIRKWNISFQVLEAESTLPDLEVDSKISSQFEYVETH